MKGVYLIQIENTNIFKIGSTKKSPQSRLKSLQTGSPFNLILREFYETEFYYTKIEHTLHRQFKFKKYIPENFDNLQGEWFQLDNDDIENFLNSCKKIEENLNFLENNSTLNFD